MIPIFGVPFLERMLSRLREAGITHAILAAGYLPEAITRSLGDGSRLGMNITYVIEATPLGTAGAIRNVAEYLTGPFFVLNGDIMTDLDLVAMIALHRGRGGLGVLHLTRVKDPSAFGCVVHDADGRVRSFVEKPPHGQELTNEINAGTYLLDPAVLEEIPRERNVSIERETFPRLLASGAALYAYATDDYWIDIGRPEHYHAIHRDVLDGALRLGALADPTVQQGHFYLPGQAGIPGNILAPSFLGAGVTLADGAVVGPYAVLGNNVRLGSNASVSRSIIWENSAVEAGVRIEGAIIASDAQIGRDATIQPGAVIGHRTIIAPETIVPSDARITPEVKAS